MFSFWFLQDHGLQTSAQHKMHLETSLHGNEWSKNQGRILYISLAKRVFWFYCWRYFWPFWSKEHWDSFRLGWGFLCKFQVHHGSCISGTNGCDAALCGGAWVLIAHDCWVFNRCLLLFKQTVIPSVFMAFSTKLLKTLLFQMQWLT